MHIRKLVRLDITHFCFPLLSFVSFGLLGLLKCARLGYTFNAFNIDEILSVGQEIETGQWIFFFFLFIDYVFGSR